MNRDLMRIVLVGAVALFGASCATPKLWQATGGSRADGTVKLSFQYGGFERPQVDEAQGLAALNVSQPFSVRCHRFSG